MKVPFVDLQKEHRIIRDELNQAVERVMERCDFALGEDVTHFEEEFAAFCVISASMFPDIGQNSLFVSHRGYSSLFFLSISRLFGALDNEFLNVFEI